MYNTKTKTNLPLWTHYKQFNRVYVFYSHYHSLLIHLINPNFIRNCLLVSNSIFLNPIIIATWWRKPLIFYLLNPVTIDIRVTRKVFTLQFLLTRFFLFSYIVHCPLYIVHCTLYIVHCTLYNKIKQWKDSEKHGICTKDPNVNAHDKRKFIKVLDEIERAPGFHPCSGRKGKKNYNNFHWLQVI